jgi:hypothetical protein
MYPEPEPAPLLYDYRIAMLPGTIIPLRWRGPEDSGCNLPLSSGQVPAFFGTSCAIAASNTIL